MVLLAMSIIAIVKRAGNLLKQTLGEEEIATDAEHGTTSASSSALPSFSLNASRPSSPASLIEGQQAPPECQQRQQQKESPQIGEYKSALVDSSQMIPFTYQTEEQQQPSDKGKTVGDSSASGAAPIAAEATEHTPLLSLPPTSFATRDLKQPRDTSPLTSSDSNTSSSEPATSPTRFPRTHSKLDHIPSALLLSSPPSRTRCTRLPKDAYLQELHRKKWRRYSEALKFYNQAHPPTSASSTASSSRAVESIATGKHKQLWWQGREWWPCGNEFGWVHILAMLLIIFTTVAFCVFFADSTSSHGRMRRHHPNEHEAMWLKHAMNFSTTTSAATATTLDQPPQIWYDPNFNISLPHGPIQINVTSDGIDIKITKPTSIINKLKPKHRMRDTPSTPDSSVSKHKKEKVTSKTANETKSS